MLGRAFFSLILLLSVSLYTARATPTAEPELDRSVLIPAGDFPWGDKFGDGEETEARGGSLYLAAFWIDRYPVTNAEYAEFQAGARGTPPRFSANRELSDPGKPVVGVNWDEANAFCASKKKRLPSEFEWEKAARGGKPVRYPWGDTSPDKMVGVALANYAAGPLWNDDGFRLTAPVGAFEKNVSAFGVYDMVGNVWQWTSTRFDPLLNQKLPQTEPRVPVEPPGEGDRTVRGGSWANSAWTIRTTTRIGMPVESREPTVGFRCARNGEEAHP